MGNSCGLLMDEDAREQREMKQYYKTRRPRAPLPQNGPEAIYGPSHAYTVATALPDMAEATLRSRLIRAPGPARRVDGVYVSVGRERGHSNASEIREAPARGMPRPRGASIPQDYHRGCPKCGPSYNDRLNLHGDIPVSRLRRPSDSRSRTGCASDNRSRARQSPDSRSRTTYPSVPTEAPPNMPRQYILDADFVSAGGETQQGAADRRARYRAQQQAFSSLGNGIASAIS